MWFLQIVRIFHFFFAGCTNFEKRYFRHAIELTSSHNWIDRITHSTLRGHAFILTGSHNRPFWITHLQEALLFNFFFRLLSILFNFVLNLVHLGSNFFLFHDLINKIYGKKSSAQYFRCKKDETTKERRQMLSKGSLGRKIDTRIGRTTGLR